jgi:hypothetical protein
MEKKIGFYVVLIHSLLFALMLISPFSAPPKKQKQMAIRTIRPLSTIKALQPRNRASSQGISSQTVSTQPSNKASTKNIQAVDTSTQQSGVEPVVSKPTSAKPQTQPKSKAFNAQDISKDKGKEKNKTATSLPKPASTSPLRAESLQSSPSPKRPALEVPQALAFSYTSASNPTLSQAGSLPLSPSEELSDYERIILYMHEVLHLPEFGEVKIELKIASNGRVDKLVVLKAESLKNKAYLEKNLPLLDFSYLNKADKKAETLIFTFCNEN